MVRVSQTEVVEKGKQQAARLRQMAMYCNLSGGKVPYDAADFTAVAETLEQAIELLDKKETK